MGEIKTIIWDLDGTLIDSFGIFVEAMADILPKHGKVFPGEAVIAANYHGPLEEAIEDAAGGNLPPEELDAIKGEFLALQDTQYEIIEGHLFKDAEALARRAHEAGTTQVIVTNRDHVGRNNASPRSIVANSELIHYIDRVVCGDDSEHRKPKPEVLGDFKYTPDETLVIGDQFVDAEFAYNIGAKAVLVARNGDDPPHLDRLSHDWQSHVILVDNLDKVAL
jgi:phosphoglycolate phosphatase-like HAD superfamily hydrolase